MTELTPTLLIFLSVIFLMSGMVKGLAGFGMPLIAIPAATLFTGVPVTTAMAWALIPIISTNFAQAVGSRQHFPGVVRLWPLYVGLLGSMLISVQLLAHIDSDNLSLVVGVMILVVVLTQAIKPWHIEPRWQPAFLAGSGVISGTFGGMTSFFGFPAIQTLLAVGITTGEFIFAVSAMFLLGSIIIAAALGGFGLMTSNDLLLSFICLLPALAGMRLGQLARSRVSVVLFKRIVLVLLIATGCSMVLSSLL